MGELALGVAEAPRGWNKKRPPIMAVPVTPRKVDINQRLLLFRKRVFICRVWSVAALSIRKSGSQRTPSQESYLCYDLVMLNRGLSVLCRLAIRSRRLFS